MSLLPPGLDQYEECAVQEPPVIVQFASNMRSLLYRGHGTGRRTSGIEDGKRYIGGTDGWTMVGRTVSLDEEMTCNARDNRFQFPGAITISITKITNTYTI